MKVRVLGCSGAIARECRTTSFLVDGDVLVDAGTGVGDLTLDEMVGVDHVLLTHAHLDHVAALPLMLDAIAARRGSPVLVHALAGTIEALKAHIFNDVIWPDFTRLPTVHAPFIRFEEIRVGQVLRIGDKLIEVLPAQELDCIAADRKYPIYITHTKPAETELIMSEIRKLEGHRPSARQAAHDIRWLQAGQEFEL